MVSTSGAVASSINSIAASYKWVQILQASSVGQTVTVQVKATTSAATSAFDSTLKEASRQTKQAAKAKPKAAWKDSAAWTLLMRWVNVFAQWGFNTVRLTRTCSLATHCLIQT